MALEIVQHIIEHEILGIRSGGGVGDTNLYNGQGNTITGVTCDASVTVGDAVYLSGANTVERAIATSVTAATVVGFVIDKPISTICSVAFDGIVKDFPGIIPNTQYFLSSNIAGAITEDPPVADNQILVKIGIGWDVDKFLIQIDPSRVIRTV